MRGKVEVGYLPSIRGKDNIDRFGFKTTPDKCTNQHDGNTGYHLGLYTKPDGKVIVVCGECGKELRDYA